MGVTEWRRSSEYSNGIGVKGRRDDVASAYVLCPLILCSSQFGGVSEDVKGV